MAALAPLVHVLMATQLFFRDTAGGTGLVGPVGRDIRSVAKSLSTSRGPNVTSNTTATVTGPTSGVEWREVTFSEPATFITAPFDADVTISGAITVNLWMHESSMSANVSAQIRIYRMTSVGTLTQILDSENGAELGTSSAAQNWAPTPTSTAFTKGDRLLAIVLGNDTSSATMASGFTFTFSYDENTPAGVGDSHITLTETIGFLAETASGTIYYMTDTNSSVNPGSTIEKVASTTRGGSVVNKAQSSVAGWTAPFDASDGTDDYQWFTGPLTAFTLTAPVRVSVAITETSDVHSTPWCAIDICDTDGTNPVAWAAGIYWGESGPSENADQFTLAGDDVSVTSGQRLRIRVGFDDSPQQGPMLSGGTLTSHYNGPNSTSGDTWVQFTQTITEQAAATRVPRSTPYPQLIAH